jgi:hypothetical protein
MSIETNQARIAALDHLVVSREQVIHPTAKTQLVINGNLNALNKLETSSCDPDPFRSPERFGVRTFKG